VCVVCAWTAIVGTVIWTNILPEPEHRRSMMEVHTLSGTAFDETTGYAGRLFNRDEEPRTQPYEELETPDTDGDFQFPPVVGDLPAPPVQPEPGAQDEPSGEITGILDAVRKLINGEGNFQDIIKIGMTIFALFGGAQMGSSDWLFKLMLSLFSGKANYDDILEERVRNRRVKRRLRR
jgi:hypothetical protein